MNTKDIPIASPCGADWTTMKPGDTGRFCGACKKTVHDLSSMTRVEARALLEAPPSAGLCVRYLYDAHGEVAFRSMVPANRLVRAKRAIVAAAALALPMSIAACAGASEHYAMMGSAVATATPSASVSTPPPQPTNVMMGDVAMPNPVPSASPDAGAPNTTAQ